MEGDEGKKERIEDERCWELGGERVLKLERENSL